MSVPPAWLEEIVQLELPSGRARYLLEVSREPCTECATGTRTLSLWLTCQGTGEAVTWCGHCFNATCDTVRLEGEYLERSSRVRDAVRQGRISHSWAAARPALEDLERRGLL